MYNKEINREIRIKYVDLPKRNREVEINDNYKKIQTQTPEKSLRGQPLHSKVEEGKTYEDINQDTSEKKMRCFGAQR